MQQHLDLVWGSVGGGVVHPRFQGINPKAQEVVPMRGAGPRAVFLSVDFFKAYNSVFHSYLDTFF